MQTRTRRAAASAGVRKYSTPIDVWSVGCIMAELLTKETLFPGKAEFDQISRIFKLLGAPTPETWPGASALPHMQKARRWLLLSISLMGKSAIQEIHSDRAPYHVFAGERPSLIASVLMHMKERVARCSVSSAFAWICCKFASLQITLCVTACAPTVQLPADEELAAREVPAAVAAGRRAARPVRRRL